MNFWFWGLLSSVGVKKSFQHVVPNSKIKKNYKKIASLNAPNWIKQAWGWATLRAATHTETAPSRIMLPVTRTTLHTQPMVAWHHHYHTATGTRQRVWVWQVLDAEWTVTVIPVHSIVGERTLCKAHRSDGNSHTVMLLKNTQPTNSDILSQ